MIKIDVRLLINAPKDAIWKIISKIDDDPHYWKRISSIKNVSKERNYVTREITLLNGSKCLQKITIVPKEEIRVRCTRGPAIGEKDILLNSSANATILEVRINQKESGVAPTAHRNMLEEMQHETEQALHLIKRAAEKTSKKLQEDSEESR